MTKNIAPFSHAHIWQAIDRLAAAHGYSASGLARQAGLDPTSFNRSKRLSADKKPRWPSTESIAKILAVTGATMSDFIALMDENDKSATIPMIEQAQSGAFDASGRPTGTGWTDMFFPQQADLYALKVSGNSMQPLYRDGDILILSPSAKCKTGDRVLTATRDGMIRVGNYGDQSDIQWAVRILWASQ